MSRHTFFIILALLTHGFARAEENSFISSLSSYNDLKSAAVADPETFWHAQAQTIPWISPYTAVWSRSSGNNDPFVGQWFVNGKLNAASICVDRWAERHGTATAMIWVAEDDDATNPHYRIISYGTLARDVNRVANLLKEQGVRKGDRVGIWMPMIPELPITQLACAKIGAVAVVVFTGFSNSRAEERFTNAQCKVIVTADGGRRKGCSFPIRSTLSTSFIDQPFLSSIITFDHVSLPYTKTDKDRSWNGLVAIMPDTCLAEAMDSEDPLFILYTSGTTGTPKGIVHTTAGYLIYAMTTMRYTWDIHGLLFPQKNFAREVWFCTADIGWITGHSYVTYAPLALGTIVVLFEGLPTHPSPETLYSLIDRYQVSHLYTSPTLVRQLAAHGEASAAKYSLKSLRALGSVGEPILPETWQWYHKNLGKSRCPIIDTYWQTETGGYLLTPISGVTSLRPGSCCHPFLSIQAKILRDDGTEAQKGESGHLCICNPWPGMMRTIFSDHNRFVREYLDRFPGSYATGDQAVQDSDGYIWILGRTDDVVKIAGHRLGTSELEAAVATFPDTVESAVVAIPDPIKDNALIVFIVAKQPVTQHAIQRHLREVYGPIAVPKQVISVSDLPKTRSGKIMRRLLRNLYLGNPVGDISTLINPEVLANIQEAIKNQQ